MLRKQIDVLAVGDITTDAFIRLKDAHVSCKLNTEDCELCLRFGDKIPFEYVKVVKAVGNAANAAVAAARLGLRSALVSNIGDDQNGRECLAELQKNKVVTTFIKVQKNKPTNYHFVLWYDVDRTILVNHTEFDYRLPSSFHSWSSHSHYNVNGIPPKWMYLTSLAANTFPYHSELADYLEANPKVKVCFQPGTFQMKLGLEALKRIYARTDLLVVNLEEARRLLGLGARSLKLGEIAVIGRQPETDAKLGKQTETNAKQPVSMNETSANHGADIKFLLKGLANRGPKLVAITDSINGSYLFDGDHYYHMPTYPDPRPAFERTGCGDAWASTFVSALAMGKSPLESLTWAPVNPMSVAQFVGSQEGLLTLDQIEWWLHRAAADYKPREI
jgi:ribokinase